MGLSKVKIGDCVEQFSQACEIPNLTEWEVSGINKDKEFFEPSKQVGKDTSNYKIVPPNYFACNLMHVGRDKILPIALNHTTTIKNVSPAYTIFKLRTSSNILKDYFFMLLKSNERDRYFWFHTDSSVRDGMTWADFCDLDINVPPLDIQQKYVAIYSSMLANQQNYERGLEDLKLTCDAFIENLRREIPCKKLDSYIMETNIRNKNLDITEIKGVSSDSNFITTKANTNGLDFSNYKIVFFNHFAYNPSRINLGSIALSKSQSCIVSPMYITFDIINKQELLPEYLMMWFSRKEFQRSTLFFATGSVRDIFTFELMQEIKIPIPDIQTQQSIVNIYNAYMERKKINEQLKEQIRSICPILIKGSLEEAKNRKDA